MNCRGPDCWLGQPHDSAYETGEAAQHRISLMAVEGAVLNAVFSAHGRKKVVNPYPGTVPMIGGWS